MTVETEEDLLALQRIGKIVAECLRAMLDHIRPGMSTLELDGFGRRFLDGRGARSAPTKDYDFPGTTCISINEEVAHGIPGDRIIAEGDVINVDVSAELDGYYADTGGTIVVPPGAELAVQLCAASRRTLTSAIAAARAGERLSAIGRAIELEARISGFELVRNLCSHGVGRRLHEPPEQILPYYSVTEKRRLGVGDVITIEPFLTTGLNYVTEGSDGWTLLNKRGSFTAQYEHTLVITRGHPIVLTAA